MQAKFFTILVSDPGGAEEEMNRFLRAHRVLELKHHFVEDGANSKWCFLATYLDGKAKGAGREERMDYKDVLDEASFARFCALRKARKRIAEEEGVPAFAVFTDKQMAGLAENEAFSVEAMRKVEGIGAGKAERYGPAIQRMLAEAGENLEGAP